jgi:lipopolysaccharide transport system ATP-binding protein
LPDTAFGLSRLWPLERESAEFASWRAALDLEEKYVVIQACAAVGKCNSIIESLLQSMGGVSAVILPVCWCHGDRAERFPKLKNRVFLSREWLGPKLMSEIIGRSELVVASSLHACITALSYGVPVARVPIAWGPSKFDLLDEFEGAVPIGQKDALARLVQRGRRIEPRVIECADRLDRYWDEVRDVVLQPPIEHSNLSRALMLGWAAKVCGDRKQLGLTRRFAVSLRKSLARYFPRQRAALRHGFWLLQSSVSSAFRWAVRTVSPPAAEPTLVKPKAKPKANAEIPPVPADGVATGKP